MVRFSNSRSNRAAADRGTRRRDARRLEILHAAAAVFRERGFAATGMREIALAADLSPANLYHYFRGKHELLYFCQATSLERLHAALRAAQRSGDGAGAQLRRVIAAHVECTLGELAGAAAHLEVDALPAELRRKIVVKRDAYERGLRRLVAAGVESGEFTDCDPKLVTQAILGAVNWTARWFRPDGARTPQEVGEAFADFLVRGVSTGAARGNRTAGGIANARRRTDGRSRAHAKPRSARNGRHAA